MREGLQLRSKTGSQRLITGLEERGFVSRLHKCARAIDALKRHTHRGVAKHRSTPNSRQIQ